MPEEAGLGAVSGVPSAPLQKYFLLEKVLQHGLIWDPQPSFFHRYVLGIYSVPGTLHGAPHTPSPEPSRAPARFWPRQPYSAPGPSRNLGGGRHSTRFFCQVRTQVHTMCLKFMGNLRVRAGCVGFAGSQVSPLVPACLIMVC